MTEASDPIMYQSQPQFALAWRHHVCVIGTSYTNPVRHYDLVYGGFVAPGVTSPRVGLAAGHNLPGATGGR